MDELSSEFLFELKIDVHAPVSMGQTEAGERRMVVIAGGTFEGPKLRGEIMPGGSDAIFVEPNGLSRIDVRGVLRTHDGAYIYIEYFGRRHGPPDVLAKLAAGEPVDPSSYYFRVAFTFETGDPRYDWMNSIIAVAKGARPPQGPVYRVFQIL
ncbi:hypothetical protein FHS85_003316 [Rhodoligotrophos appendicifer]|uniref:DUF3237 domain-containing protein n=1 Tax=Rhodoligotrophos appendicifer TaxID=987056 RepID=UPI0011862F58|nr:DUF3237 domain-containing protein [Rhodoligotrophos appendicifer]